MSDTVLEVLLESIRAGKKFVQRSYYYDEHDADGWHELEGVDLSDLFSSVYWTEVWDALAARDDTAIEGKEGHEIMVFVKAEGKE